VNSILKGNKLEDAFHQYLVAQKERGDLVFDAYPAEQCEIHKKKRYFCTERNGDVEFDVVIEFFQRGRSAPHSYVVFECKNHNGSIPELLVNDFSSKLSRIFRNAAKGVFVSSSRLQSGAENVARHSKMGIVKYDENGIEIIADRRGPPIIEYNFAQKQIFDIDRSTKSLKFSAFYGGNYFGTIRGMLESMLGWEQAGGVSRNADIHSVPHIEIEVIKECARDILARIDYQCGPVDLSKVCNALSIDLQFTNEHAYDIDGVEILGSANFERGTILINAHDNVTRERFTLGHEIGHFALNHKSYLISERVLEIDLKGFKENQQTFNYDRLEFQANEFASALILPDELFKKKTAEFRQLIGITVRGHGYIFVDDQPDNYHNYEKLLTQMLTYFEVSKQAIHHKFQKLGMLTDQRSRSGTKSVGFGKIQNPYRNT
jgi:Zn-dependent peptidase ImmA (M78 family)